MDRELPDLGIDATEYDFSDPTAGLSSGASDIVVIAVALINILACLLANILVATRLTYSMSRDNMLPLSHLWRHVSPVHRSPTFAVMALGALSTALLSSALVNAQAFNYILGTASLAFFGVYILQTIGLLFAYRRGTIPAAEPGTFDLGRFRLPIYVVSLAVCVAVTLAVLPQFRVNVRVFAGMVVLGVIWWAFGLRPRLREGNAGPRFAQTPRRIGV